MWLTLILLLFAVPPLFGLVALAVYKVATARHPGFWLLTVLWAVALTAWVVLAVGYTIAESGGECAGLPPQFWMERLAPLTVLGLGGLTIATFVRRMAVGNRRRRPDELELMERYMPRPGDGPEPPAHSAGETGPGSRQPRWSLWLLLILGAGMLVGGQVWFGKTYSRHVPNPHISPAAVVLWVAGAGIVCVVVPKLFPRWAKRRREAQERRAREFWTFSRKPSITILHALFTKMGAAIVLGGLALTGLGWVLVRDPILCWVFGGMFTFAVLLIHASHLRAVAARAATDAADRAVESPAGTPLPPDLTPPGADRPNPAPPPRRPNLRLAGAAVLLAGAVIVVWATTKADLKPATEDQFVDQVEPAAPVNADPQVVAMPMLAIGGAVVAVAGGVGVVVLRAVRRPKRKLSQQELDALVKSIRPLGREQRKIIFWSYLGVMALGVFFVLETVFSKMGPGASSIFVSVFVGMAAVSMTLGVREWAFKRTPADGGMPPAAGPLAVAPLVLTPDPIPAGGTCPTCGGPIPAGSPQGLCPRCLIRGAMPSANATRARSVRPVDPPPPAEVNEFFPHLEVLELVGAGGMGAVYKARQPNLDRVVALKIVQSPTGDDDPVFAERFTREARAMARLDHPNIVTIHESGEAGGLPYMLMEFVDGITLRDAMENKVLTTSEALAVIPQICDALDYAHRNGVVHRDIKPENILIDQTGRVKIADFGLAKLAEAGGISLTHTRQAMGTPHYMAPEQWEKPNEVDHRADIYALGVVLYELLTGELPLGRFDLPSAKGKGSPRLDQVVLRALAKEPGQRYQHASDLKGALSKLGNWRDSPSWRRGFHEYRSKRTFLGLPLVHVVRGRDPATGRLQTAKGWVAVSDGTAVGGIAVGGVSAFGGIAVGGVAGVGVLGVGGAAGVGVIALGGTALGLALAVGGAAIAAGLAIGGVAIGTFAIGGAAVGQYTLGGTGNTPEFWGPLRRAVVDVLEF